MEKKLKKGMDDAQKLRNLPLVMQTVSQNTTTAPSAQPRQSIRYSVAAFRNAGLEAKWGKSRRGAPFIFARNPKAANKHQRETWWLMDGGMWREAERIGIVEAFDGATLLGDIFSTRA